MAAREGDLERPPQPKTFTIDGANATLPLVKVIVRDAMEKWRELGHLRADLADSEVHGSPERAKKRVREDVERLERDLEGCIREVAALGATIKDFEVGLVDFPMRHRSRTVLLCWKAGERRIAFWHEAEAGVAGRRPIEELPEGP